MFIRLLAPLIYFNRFSRVVVAVKFSNSLLYIVAVAFVVALFVVAFPISLLSSLLLLLLLNFPALY